VSPSRGGRGNCRAGIFRCSPAGLAPARPPPVLRSGPSSTRFAASHIWDSARHGPGVGREPGQGIRVGAMHKAARRPPARCRGPAPATAAKTHRAPCNRRNGPRLLGVSRARRDSTACRFEQRLRRLGNPPRVRFPGGWYYSMFEGGAGKHVRSWRSSVVQVAFVTQFGATSQSKRNCSPPRAGGRNKSQRNGIRFRLSPSRAAPTSNLRPIIRA
jgi:hypothetical protein